MLMSAFQLMSKLLQARACSSTCCCCCGRRQVCTVLPNQPGDYPSVKGHRQQPWQETGLAKVAIKASTGNLRLTHTDRIVAAFPHMHALYSNCEVESSPWVTSDDFTISLFVCVSELVGSLIAWLLAITYCIHCGKPIIPCKLIKLV